MSRWDLALLALAACGLVLGLVLAPILLVDNIRDQRRCEHAGGEWVGNHCLDKASVIHP